MVAGVAEGLSRHFDIDPILVRVTLAALTLFGGAGIVLYLLAWITIPQEGRTDSIVSAAMHRDPTRITVAGLSIAAVVAAITVIGAIGFSAPEPLPVLVVSALALLAFALLSRRSDRRQVQYRPAPAEADAPTSELPLPSGSSVADAASTSSRGWWRRNHNASGDGDGTGSSSTGYPSPPRRPREPRSHLFAATMAVVAIAMGLLWILERTVYDNMPVSVFPGVVLSIVAAALLVGTWFGRSRLLIVVGIVATVATAATTVVGPGPYGETIHRPASANAVQDEYEHGAGRLVLHLENMVDPQGLGGRAIDINAGVGQVEVVVPSSIAVVVDAKVDHGEIYGPDGSDIAQLDQGGEYVVMSSAGDGPADLTIDVNLRYGQIVITQHTCPGATGTAPTVGLDTISVTEGTPNAPACN
jgi:phage shock protein PspC (stress-responsive transcriptional regulator)